MEYYKLSFRDYKCPQCGENFRATKWKKGKCCSIHCGKLKTELQPKPCLQCGKEFRPRQLKIHGRTQKYCSLKCSYIAKTKVKGINHFNYKRIKTNCAYCKKEMLMIPFYKDKNRTCSKECAMKLRQLKVVTIKTKQKISQIAKKKGFGKWMKGRKNELSPSWNGGKPKCLECGKILANYDAIRCSNCFKRVFLEIVKKRQELKEPTSIEKKLYNELKNRGLLFETQKLINGKFLVDAYIPSLNLIIEADGDYWHSLDRVIKKDKAENAYLKKCGFNLLRLSETEINNTSFGERIG